jgi:hypothetical protein
MNCGNEHNEIACPNCENPMITLHSQHYFCENVAAVDSPTGSTNAIFPNYSVFVITPLNHDLTVLKKSKKNQKE